MYAVRTWASHALLAQSPYVPTLSATFDQRGAAFEAGDLVPFPIVSILDIGAEGRCPGRPSIPQRTPTDGWAILPQGHRFERVAENADREGIWECADCHAWEGELYYAGTLLPRPADNDIMGAPGACECCGSPQTYTHGLCAYCIEACEGGKPHVEPVAAGDGHDCNLHR